MRSSSSSRWLANSATTSRGFRRRPSAHSRSTSAAAGLEQREVVGDRRPRCPGRSTLTATSRAVRAARRSAPARPTRSRPASRSNELEHFLDAVCPATRSISATACADGNGGTRSCSFASSSAMSSGSRSRRVDSIWPNLTKIGPSVSSAWRSRRARGRATTGKGYAARSAGRPQGCAPGGTAYSRRSSPFVQPGDAHRATAASGSRQRLELGAAHEHLAFPRSRNRPARR